MSKTGNLETRTVTWPKPGVILSGARASQAGDVMWRDAEEHSVENLGDADVHVILIELK